MFVLQKLIVLKFCDPKKTLSSIQKTREEVPEPRKQTLPKKHKIFDNPGYNRGFCFVGTRLLAGAAFAKGECHCTRQKACAYISGSVPQNAVSVFKTYC
jgi:hypothetical protein